MHVSSSAVARVERFRFGVDPTVIICNVCQKVMSLQACTSHTPPPLYKLRPCVSYSGCRDRINLDLI